MADLQTPIVKNGLGVYQENGKWFVKTVMGGEILLETANKEEALQGMNELDEFLRIWNDEDGIRSLYRHKHIYQCYNDIRKKFYIDTDAWWYQIEGKKGVRNVRGVHVSPYLAVRKSKERWIIDHLPSKKPLSSCSTKEKAIEVVEKISNLLPWEMHDAPDRIEQDDELQLTLWMIRLDVEEESTESKTPERKKPEQKKPESKKIERKKPEEPQTFVERVDFVPEMPKNIPDPGFAEGASLFDELVQLEPSLIHRRQAYDDAMKELNELIGLTGLKEEIEILAKRLIGAKKLEKTTTVTIKKPTLHMTFSGSPGTGKTVVAKIISKLLFALGYTRKQTVVEANRATLISSNVGGTAQNVLRIIKESLGGVLFIDEAYSLASSKEGTNSEGFASEAIDTLIQGMEDYREDLVVILAGYPHEMDRLIEKNKGFRSRIAYPLVFPDYTPQEIEEIVYRLFKQNNMSVVKVEKEIKQLIRSVVKNGKISGNARWARTAVEKITNCYLLRIAESNPGDMTYVYPEDVAKAFPGKNIYSSQSGKEELKKAALNKLNDMVGMPEVKQELEQLLMFIDIEQKKFAQGHPVERPRMHMVFFGPAGSGKTTIARLIGEFLNSVGILEHGHFIETDREGLVAAYSGQTAIKVKDVVKSALGGVLFIDEAYGLYNGDNDSFGAEAIQALIKEMEDHKENLVVILAGYEKEMKKMLKKNPGFESRISNFFYFTSYAAEEIMQICQLKFEKRGYSLTEEAHAQLQEVIRLHEQKHGEFNGNGRWAEKLFEKVIRAQSVRLFRSGEAVTMSIQPADIAQGIAGFQAENVPE